MWSKLLNLPEKSDIAFLFSNIVDLSSFWPATLSIKRLSTEAGFFISRTVILHSIPGWLRLFKIVIIPCIQFYDFFTSFTLYYFVLLVITILDGDFCEEFPEDTVLNDNEEPNAKVIPDRQTPADITSSRSMMETLEQYVKSVQS